MQSNLKQAFDKANLSKFHYAFVVLCFCLTTINGFGVVTLSIALPVLSKEWGIATSSFAPAHMAVMFGVLLGSFLGGYLSDKFGRKRTILLMSLLMCLAMGATVLTREIKALIVMRFITGIGAGAAIPVVLALTTELIPSRYRNLLVILVFAGPPFSGIIAGNLGPTVMAAIGWTGVFWLGVTLAIPAIVISFFLLVESPNYLLRKENLSDLNKVLPKFSINEDAKSFVRKHNITKVKSPISELFNKQKSVVTLLIWTMFFCFQFVMFYLNLWVPSLLVNEGWSVSDGGKALAMFNLGSFAGGFIIGYLSDRYGVRNVLTYLFILSIISLYILSGCTHNPNTYFVMAFLAGGTILGSNMGLGPFSAMQYPLYARGTGIGAALGFGRIGSITAAFLGGQLIAMGIHSTLYFRIGLIPLSIATLAIITLKLYTNNSDRTNVSK